MSSDAQIGLLALEKLLLRLSSILGVINNLFKDCIEHPSYAGANKAAPTASFIFDSISLLAESCLQLLRVPLAEGVVVFKTGDLLGDHRCLRAPIVFE